MSCRLESDCGGCSCHIAPPCSHCTEHTCEHDLADICDDCLTKKFEALEDDDDDDS